MKWMALGTELLCVLLFWRAWGLCRSFPAVWRGAGRSSFWRECWLSFGHFFKGSQMAGMGYVERGLMMVCVGAGSVWVCLALWAAPSWWSRLASCLFYGQDLALPAGKGLFAAALQAGADGAASQVSWLAERMALPSFAVLCGQGARRSFLNILGSGAPEALPLAQAAARIDGLARSEKEAQALSEALGPAPAAKRDGEPAGKKARSL